MDAKLAGGEPGVPARRPSCWKGEDARRSIVSLPYNFGSTMPFCAWYFPCDPCSWFAVYMRAVKHIFKEGEWSYAFGFGLLAALFSIA
jgi:hypothetical protein